MLRKMCFDFRWQRMLVVLNTDFFRITYIHPPLRVLSLFTGWLTSNNNGSTFSY